ncbi:MAG: ATP-binding protein [Betaproteobacteria bacterium]|nr:ATP-binding protein [Betaproteobacteria bacterium]
MKLKPWYDVVKPREDLREGKPLDASEFAVHLDKVRLGNAPDDYKIPQRFFDRTYLTGHLTGMAAEVVRRLSGVTTETSAVFNMTTQFGGGKTHALTMLYHLAKHGSAANGWRGVSKILERAGVKTVPDNCAIAIFVGTEFDSVTGRGGDDGTPRRQTPWGEIAWQLGGAEAFAHVAKHDADFQEPKGDVIDKMLPHDRPCLILMDEVLSFFSSYRKSGYGTALYNFMQSLSETVRGRENVVFVASVPKSDYSYTQDDTADEQRLKHLLNRVSKSVILSSESDASEIIRRRLFEWDASAFTPDGRVILNKDAEDACGAYADWVQEHRQQLPSLINPDLAREEFKATYPFHPMVISVFERKWRSLPRFQQTRGILRLLALWVSSAYQAGYKGAQRDPMITLGTAPLDDPMFRAAMFEQLGQTLLEAAVTTDIAGKKDAHAVRLDAEAINGIKKARLHRKVATTIFFESNGGQIGSEAQEASIPEIRLAVGEPESDIGNIETVLEALTDSCYYLNVEKTRYKFSLKENLNKRFSDRRATVQGGQIDEEVKREIQKIFPPKENIERVFFPENSIQVSDRPVVTILVAGLNQTMEDGKSTRAFAEKIVRESGTSARTFKSALIWVVAESAQPMRDEARKILAWQAISDESADLKLDEAQKKQLVENVQKARRDLKESIWRGYKHLLLLGKDNALKSVDLGLVHSSAADSPISNILNRLSTDGDVETKGVSPNFLVRNWPPAFKEWATKSLRDAFYSSPTYPRVPNSEFIKGTIARGVESGMLAYVGKTAAGKYLPFAFGQSITPYDIEFSDDMFVITAETATAYVEQEKKNATVTSTGPDSSGTTSATPNVPDQSQPVPTSPDPTPTKVAGIKWAGDVPPQKWMNFYTKILSRFAGTSGLKLTIHIDVNPPDGLSKQTLEETKGALRELGLKDELDEI